MQLMKQLCLILVASCLAISPLQAAEEQHDESQAEAKASRRHTATTTPSNCRSSSRGFPRNTGPGSPGMAAPLLMILTSMSSSPAGWASGHLRLRLPGGLLAGGWRGDRTPPRRRSEPAGRQELPLALGIHEGRTRIAPAIARKAGITTAAAGPSAIERSLTTYGS